MLRRSNVIVTLFMALALVAGIPSAGAQQDKTRAGIEAANARLIAALAAGNAAAVADCYTPEAQMLPANSEVVSGREAIEQLWGGWIAAGVRKLTLEALEVEGFGKTAVEVGRYTLPGEDGKLLDAGKYVVVWKRHEGKWKLHRDIWTTDLPAAPAAQ
jgi:uncharacterized protein (TIGR02246 family)